VRKTPKVGKSSRSLKNLEVCQQIVIGGERVVGMENTDRRQLAAIPSAEIELTILPSRESSQVEAIFDLLRVRTVTRSFSIMSTATLTTASPLRNRQILLTDNAIEDLKELHGKNRIKAVHMVTHLHPHLCKKLEPHALGLWVCKVKDDLRAIFRIEKGGALLILHVSQRNGNRVYQFIDSYQSGVIKE
jgi:hypothetical protein